MEKRGRGSGEEKSREREGSLTLAVMRPAVLCGEAGPSSGPQTTSSLSQNLRRNTTVTKVVETKPTHKHVTPAQFYDFHDIVPKGSQENIV